MRIQSDENAVYFCVAEEKVHNIIGPEVELYHHTLFVTTYEREMNWPHLESVLVT